MARSYLKVILPIELIRKQDPGLTLSAATVAVFLYIAQYPERSVAEYGKLAELGRSQISRHILVLTQRGDRALDRPGLGLIETYEDRLDSRIKRCKLSPKGQRLLNDIDKVMEA